MKNEIDKDFYCSRYTGDIGCIEVLNQFRECSDCECYHRKHPTPEQYKNEYGEDVPDDMPVWVAYQSQWKLDKYKTFKTDDVVAVVACTPFPKPDDGWRPE